MLLQNKGYTLVHKSQQGNDIYLAIEPETGNVCIITANEGSQYFKEIILPEEVTDRLFSIIYKDYEVQPDSKAIVGDLHNQSFKDMWFSDATVKRLNELQPMRDCKNFCVYENRNELLQAYFDVDTRHVNFI